MGQPPQTSQPDAQALLDFMQALELVKDGGPAAATEFAPQWMNVTIIEDDDLTFGGKPLSTWYEEDRRRCSLGDGELATFDLAAAAEEEEQRRGRQRDRPHYSKPPSSHKHHHHKKSSKVEEKAH